MGIFAVRKTTVTASASASNVPDSSADTRTALGTAFQRDEYPETTLDPHSCGAFTVVAASIMSRPATKGSLVQHLTEVVNHPRRLTLLRGAADDLADNGEMGNRSIAYLRDILQATYGTAITSNPATADGEFIQMLAGAGLHMRPVAGMNIESVVDSLRPGEMIGLRYATQYGGHVVLVGRSVGGQLYGLDSGQKAQRNRGTTHLNEEQVRGYFSKPAVRAKGRVVFYAVPREPPLATE